MLKLGSVRWKGRCGRHPQYDPEMDGLGGIRGGCRRCEMLLEIWQHHSHMMRLIREFGSRDEKRPRDNGSDYESRQMSLLDPATFKVQPGSR
jgi:hypothetical protein